MSKISKNWAIGAFILGSMTGIGVLHLYVSMAPQKYHGEPAAFQEPQGDEDTFYRFRSIADGSNQELNPTSMKEINLIFEEVWWNSEHTPNLCYQIENVGMSASSHYSIEIYRDSLKKANIMLKTKPRSPLQARQSIVACMAVPDSVRHNRDSILLVAKELP